MHSATRQLTLLSLLFLAACDMAVNQTKVIDISNLEENKLYYYSWYNNHYIVFKPAPTLLTQIDSPLLKGKEIIDPPDTISRTRYPIKVFAIEKKAGHVLLPFNKWHQYQLPCSSLVFFTQALQHGKTATSAGFRCTKSVDIFWLDHLVFDVLGRSRSRKVPDLYIPLHYQNDQQLIIGAGESSE